MSIIESTIAFLFRQKVDPIKAREKQSRRTAAILRPIVDQAMDVADCLIDNERQKANDQPKATKPHR